MKTCPECGSKLKKIRYYSKNGNYLFTGVLSLFIGVLILFKKELFSFF